MGRFNPLWSSNWDWGWGLESSLLLIVQSGYTIIFYMRLSFCFVALALGLHAPFALGTEETAAAVEVDLRFSSGPNGLPPANDMDDAQSQFLDKDGFAVFTQATQLPNSDFYIGYWLVVKKSAEDVHEPFNVQIYYNDLRGFFELEPGKLSPIMRMVEVSSWLSETDKWQDVQLRDRVSGEVIGIFYLRLRTHGDAPQSTPKPTMLEVLPKAAE